MPTRVAVSVGAQALLDDILSFLPSDLTLVNDKQRQAAGPFLSSESMKMKTMTKYLALGVLASLPLIQACEAGGAGEGTITDSAGVAIVHNTATPLWLDGDEWTVTEDLRIGSVAGEPEYQFGSLGYVDVSSDGTIYAMDMHAQEVKAYDAEGNFIPVANWDKSNWPPHIHPTRKAEA